MRTLSLTFSVLVLSIAGLSGCKSAKDAIDANPDFRKGAIEKGRTSCTEAARGSIKEAKTPEIEARIASYCDCFATKGLAQFSNSDLMEMGIKRDIDSNPVYKARMEKAVNMCVAEAKAH